MGRGTASLFRGKEKLAKYRVQGLLTPAGRLRFEAQRQRIAALTRRPLDRVSHADVIEFLARGDADSLRYIERHK